MPLTKSEKEWLATRDLFPCRSCEWEDDCPLAPQKECRSFRSKEMWEDGLSTAIFEARVAAKLAQYAAALWQHESAWHALKQARIEVEQEFYEC